MLTNYLKIAFRSMIRQWNYSLTNIIGLAIGISCCTLIMLFVKSEFSYDKFHKNADRIYRAWLQENYEGKIFTNTLTPIPLGPALKDNIPEVESFCRVNVFNSLVSFGSNKFNESITMVDSVFFDFFDFEIVEGNRQTALNNKSSIVITESLAKKYFGKDQAIGKNLELQLGKEKVMFTISAIAADGVQESNIQFDFLIPHSNDHYMYSQHQRTMAWSSVYQETYLLVQNGKSGKDVETKIPELAKKIAGDNYKENQYNVFLQPIADIHLNKSMPAGNQPTSDPAYSFILATIAILILLIACINFVSLSIGRSTTRAREVGVRKALGAEKQSLISQFWGESIIQVGIASLLSWTITYSVLPAFNQISNRELNLSFSVFNILFIFLLVVFIGCLAGLYPALILSAFSPVNALKNKMSGSLNIGIFRKSLLVGQFTASIILIIGTIVIGKQLNYLQSKNLGFDKEKIVVVNTNKPRGEGYPLAEKFKTELLQNTNVIHSGISLFSFAEPGWVTIGYTDENKVYRNLSMNSWESDFTRTMDLQIVQGRNFDENNSADFSGSMLINEALVREYGWKEPIGKKLPGRFNQRVIGVVKDFNFESLHNPIKPIMIVMQPDSVFNTAADVAMMDAPRHRISIKLKAGAVKDQISSLEQSWKKVAGNQDFDFKFLDESLNNQYREEKRLNSIVRIASFLALFIACLGLFGLATLAVVHRMKEIGIRRVLGAEIGSILILISKEFLVLIVLGNIISAPITYWALNKWLQSFVFKINIPYWAFAIAAIIVVMVALFTISIQAFKAAVSNPVKTLRME